MIKRLAYPRDRVVQETGYWCGPASIQTVLRGAIGTLVEERDIARAAGTSTRGTDSIHNVVSALKKWAPAAGWATVEMASDPPSDSEKERLWSHLCASIDHGWGVVINIVAPPNNYPRGVYGSVSPRYRGGWVYHYVAAMGVRDDGRDGKAVWIADSGFPPFGYWIGLDQLATLVPPKGYVYASSANTAPAGRYDKTTPNQRKQETVDSAPTGETAPPVTLPPHVLSMYALMTIDQLAGPKKNAQGVPDFSGWPQLDGLTLVDAVAQIMQTQKKIAEKIGL